LDVLKGKVARELAALEEQLDRVLERAFDTGVQLPARPDRFRPALDVYETEDAIVVQVEVSGVNGEDIRLIVDGEYLQIKGRRGSLYDRPPRRHLQMEIPRGNFERVLRLRASYDADRVTAKLDAGMLTVTLPRKQSAPRKIRVESA
jgi:HSP20 family protein